MGMGGLIMLDGIREEFREGWDRDQEIRGC